MAWISKTLMARLDCITPLDAAAKPAVQRYLSSLLHEVGQVRDLEVVSVRRLARGQVRADIQFRLEGDNRKTVRKRHVKTTLSTLVGSARYLTLRGVPTPLIRVYRTRLMV